MGQITYNLVLKEWRKFSTLAAMLISWVTWTAALQDNKFVARILWLCVDVVWQLFSTLPSAETMSQAFLPNDSCTIHTSLLLICDNSFLHYRKDSDQNLHSCDFSCVPPIIRSKDTFLASWQIHWFSWQTCVASEWSPLYWLLVSPWPALLQQCPITQGYTVVTLANGSTRSVPWTSMCSHALPTLTVSSHFSKKVFH